MDKKLLIVTSELPPYPGGIGKYTEHFARGTSESIDTTLFSFSQKICNEDNIYHQKFNYRLIQAPMSRFVILNFIVRLLFLMFYLIKIRPSIIIPTGLRASYFLMPFIFFSRAEFWYIGHGSEFIKSNKVLYRYLSKSQKIILNSHYTFDLFKFKYQGFVDKVEVITLGGDSDLFMPLTHDTISDFESKHSIPKDRLVLTTIGRIDDRKAQDLVIEFISKYKDKLPNLIYIIVGLEKDNGNCRNLVKKYGIEKLVKFIGFAEDNELNDIYNISDIYLQPSRYSKKDTQVEGFGIAICEASLCGVPSIGTVNSGTRDAIKEGVNGRLIKEDNIKDMYEAICDLINNLSLYRENSINYANEFLTWKTFRKKISLLF